ERRDDILDKILVLVITEHQDKVRIECLDLGSHLAEGFHQPPPVLAVCRDPLIVAILSAHSLRPVLRVLQLFRYPGITGQGAQEGPGLGLVWLDHGGPVRGPHTPYLSHCSPPGVTPYFGYVWLRGRYRVYCLAVIKPRHLNTLHE